MTELTDRLEHRATLGGAWGEEGQTVLEAAARIEELEDVVKAARAFLDNPGFWEEVILEDALAVLDDGR